MLNELQAVFRGEVGLNGIDVHAEFAVFRAEGDGFDAGGLLFVHLVNHFEHASAVQAVVRENADEVLITRGRQGR